MAQGGARLLADEAHVSGDTDLLRERAQPCHLGQVAPVRTFVVAADHQQLTMQVLRNTARKYGLAESTVYRAIARRKKTLDKGETLKQNAIA